MRRQHQRVGRQRAHPLQRGQEQRQRVGLGLVVIDADVGRDPRQQHVTRDQHAQRRAVQCDVLGRVAVAGQALPIVAPGGPRAADRQQAAVHQAPVGRRHLRHHAGVVAGAGADQLERGRVDQPVRRHEGRGGFAAGPVVGATAQARGGEIGRAHPQPAIEGLAGGRGRSAPALGEPVREADMVGVHVRRDDAQHRHAARLGREDLFPGLAGPFVGDAAIDHGPARRRFAKAVDLVAQQPQVDVVQRERQRHAQPAHAGGDLDAVAGFGPGIRPGVVRFLLRGVRLGHGSGCFLQGFEAVADGR